MQTINDILTVKDGTLSLWSMWTNEKQRMLSEITRRDVTHIQVKGYSYKTGVTVQQFIDGELDYCTHDGAIEGTRTAYAGLDEEYEIYAINCNKCDAWQDIDGGWNE